MYLAAIPADLNTSPPTTTFDPAGISHFEEQNSFMLWLISSVFSVCVPLWELLMLIQQGTFSYRRLSAVLFITPSAFL